MPQNELTRPLFLKEITLQNLLSFGPDTPPLRLHRLNVLIGPNGSGKSNLLESLSLLRAAPQDLRAAIRSGGGAGEWVWKGKPDGTATIDVVIDNPFGNQSLRHRLSFASYKQAFHLEDERIENEHPYYGESEPYFYYQYQNGQPVVNVTETGVSGVRDSSQPDQGVRRKLARETVESDASILAQRRDPETYPVITHLAAEYSKIRFYREWSFGRNTVFREPQKADMRNDRLEEDFSNLGLFLNRLRRQPKVKNAILAGLKDLYDGFTDFDVSIEGGTVQVFFTEGDFSIPATRLSDGTLRYLCLLAILCDPEPPPLIGIEEPELGLHPDILPKLADLLVAAAQRTQLLVTTHSDILVDALTETPEYVIVCEKQEGQTHTHTLHREELAEWLIQYRLGDLWMRGEIGGTRW